MEIKDNIVRMKEGRIYDPADPAIMGEQLGYLDLLAEYNALRPSDLERRGELLKQMFGAIGENCYIEQPLRANFGGKHVFMGNGVYANFNLTLVDDGNIFIGDKVMIGPNVTIATAGHPIAPSLREKGLQFNIDIHIGNNAWIGAGAIILPGVTIGENAVIGAGSVVSKDIPANCVAAGVPCRVLRDVGEHDREFYFKNRQIDI